MVKTVQFSTYHSLHCMTQQLQWPAVRRKLTWEIEGIGLGQAVHKVGDAINTAAAWTVEPHPSMRQNLLAFSSRLVK
jgi:hypothetical protein